jgi:hypothetical protein
LPLSLALSLLPLSLASLSCLSLAHRLPLACPPLVSLASTLSLLLPLPLPLPLWLPLRLPLPWLRACLLLSCPLASRLPIALLSACPALASRLPRAFLALIKI